jgi:hypothetical protein
MTKVSLNCAYVYPGSDKLRPAEMAEVVKANIDIDTTCKAPERLADRIGLHWRGTRRIEAPAALAPGQDVTIGKQLYTRIGSPALDSFSVPAQHGQAEWVECDPAILVRLRWTNYQPTMVEAVLDGTLDMQHPIFPIKIGPTETAKFLTSTARDRCQSDGAGEHGIGLVGLSYESADDGGIGGDLSLDAKWWGTGQLCNGSRNNPPAHSLLERRAGKVWW